MCTGVAANVRAVKRVLLSLVALAVVAVLASIKLRRDRGDAAPEEPDGSWQLADEPPTP